MLRSPNPLALLLASTLIAGPALAQEPAPGKAPELRALSPYVCFPDPLRKPPEPGQKQGPVDVTATINALQVCAAPAFMFLVWQGPSDFEDLKLLLAATQRAGIQMWVGVVPPTLGGNSLPFTGNYDRWAQEFAKLGREYPNLVAYFLVELDQGRNMRILHDISVGSAKGVVNAAGMSLLIGVYDLVPAVVERYAKAADGVVLHYTNQGDYRNLAGMLAGARRIAPPSWKIFPAFRCAPTDWHPVAPTPDWLYYGMRRVYKQECDGCLLVDLDLHRPARVAPAPDGHSKLFITARDFLHAVRDGRSPSPPTIR